MRAVTCLVAEFRPALIGVCPQTNYDVEPCCDFLTIIGTEYHGFDHRPYNVLVTAGTEVTWQSDFSLVQGGFTLCGFDAKVAAPPPNPFPPPNPHPPLPSPPFAPPLPPPPPQPPVSPGALWTVISGGQWCSTTLGGDGSCVTDGLADYGINEDCVFRANRELFVATDYCKLPASDQGYPLTGISMRQVS